MTSRILTPQQLKAILADGKNDARVIYLVDPDVLVATIRAGHDAMAKLADLETQPR